jgi:steroid delta-isomerase-like uncharacterized protein
MSTEQNKALVRRLVDEILNGRNLRVMDDIFSTAFVEHEELPPGTPPGREGPRILFNMLHTAFPDFKATIEQLIAEGDKAVVYMKWTGTHKGEFMGIPPTGKRFSIGVMDIIRFADGEAVEHWGIMDSATMMQQLGVMPG